MGVTGNGMNAMKTTLLLGALTGLLLFVGHTLGGQTGMTSALLMAGAMNFAACFWSDKLILRAYGAQRVLREQAPELYAIVERLAQKAGIPMPKLYVIPDWSLNAFATGRNPSHAAVACTLGLLETMNDAELEGILAHELSHVLNRDTLISTVAATLAGAISWLAHLFLVMGGHDDDAPHPIAGLAMMVLSPIAAMFIQMAVSRSREFEADATGARLVGDPRGLVGALRRLQIAKDEIPMASADPATAHLFIVNPLSGGSLMSLFSTHPPLEERILRLQSPTF